MPAVKITSPIFATRQEADAWAADHYNKFHPWGYGTALTIITVDDAYQVVGSRWDSCD